MFEILHGCCASDRKSLQGLDYFACDGSNAFDILKNLCNELISYGIVIQFFHNINLFRLKSFDFFVGVSMNKVLELNKALHESRNSLKNNYKSHLELNSEVADHCIKFGLSDPCDNDWYEDCNHSHNLECNQCLLLKNTLNELKSTINSCNMAPTLKSRYLHRFNQNSQLIWDWKAHMMRCVQQDHARIEILQNLQHDSVLILLDWAMKWLPVKYREAQRDFFGKVFSCSNNNVVLYLSLNLFENVE